MELSLQQLLPIPLKDRLSARTSDVWQRRVQWGAGEHIFVQAPSGTGKTTLIHILYGLRPDYEGTVQWGGQGIRELDAESAAALRARQVSIIFQDLRLFPELTAWENLEIKRTLTNTIATEEVSSWMERLGIGHKKESLGRTLSYGEQQRVAIIRSLLQPFSWLLMDEPFSHLDKANTARAAALIREVAERNGASFLLVDLDENSHFPYTKTLML